MQVAAKLTSLIEISASRQSIFMQREARPSETAVQDCCDAFLLGGRTGVYWYRSVGRSDRVFCDMTTDGGGWIVARVHNRGRVSYCLYWADA